MDNRVNGTPRVVTSAPANNLAPARNLAPTANATLNTTDAASFSSRAAVAPDLEELQAVVAELEARIETLENQLAERDGVSAAADAPAANATANGVVLPPGVNLPPLEGRVPAANNRPAAATPAAVAGDDDQPDEASYTENTIAGVLDGIGPEGRKAIENVLKGAKLEDLTPAEEETVTRALERVRAIGEDIGGGKAPGPFVAELFALKHTLADPAGAGKHPVVTSGAQTMAFIEDQKAALAAKFEANDAKLARKPGDAKLQREQAALESQYKAYVGIQKALDGAKLTGLSPEGERKAAAAVDRLGALAEEVAGGAAPTSIEREVYQLAQGLKPAARTEAAQAQVAQVADAGADVVGRIAAAKGQVMDRLRAIDDRIVAGDPAEVYAAERAKLLANAEALQGLGEAVQDAHLDQETPKARREVSFALAKAAAMADAIGSGAKDASQLRGDVFVLRQTLQEPVDSKDNPAIQAGAAALAVFGAAEAQNQQARAQIAALAIQGDARAQDAQLAKLARQAEDLENMRIAIEAADFGGLSPAQEAHGADVIDQMRQIGQRVAAGDDIAKYGATYDRLAGELANLRNWRGVAPQPAPQPAPRPQPQPRPAGPASVDPQPEPAAGARPYTVKKGDYLTKIAREQLGSETRWPEIVELNKAKYPGLAQNPDLVQPGWVLTIPTGGAAKPSKPKPRPAQPASTKPTPQPVTPTPGKPSPVTPAQVEPAGAAGKSDRAAVAWLRANLGAGLTREKIAQMPAGPSRDVLLTHFDAFLFGTIDPGRKGWTQLNDGDVARLEAAVRQGQSLTDLARTLVIHTLADRQIGDRNQDGRVSENDLRDYANELREQTAGGNVGPVHPPAPKPPKEDLDAKRMRQDLDAYLANPGNQKAGAIVHLLSTAPQYAVNASPEQKARMMKQVLSGNANTNDRNAALQILRMADERNETRQLLQASFTQGGIKDLMHDLGDNTQGVQAAKLLLKAGAYRDQAVWSAMDDDAAVGLAKALGFKEPMIGTSDALRRLPEAAKHHMIQQLLKGNLTWGELAIAEWINQHTEVKAQIPDYRNR